jgi:hypothetical protein
MLVPSFASPASVVLLDCSNMPGTLSTRTHLRHELRYGIPDTIVRQFEFRGHPLCLYFNSHCV